MKYECLFACSIIFIFSGRLFSGSGQSRFKNLHRRTLETEDPISIGDTMTYIVEIRSDSSGHCTNVKLTNIIPKQMKFVSCAATDLSCKLDKGKVVFDEVPFLVSGKLLIYKITCKAVRSGSAKHEAILIYDQYEKQIIDQEITKIY